MIQIGDYYIYWPVFVVLFLVFFGIFGLVLLKISRKYVKRNKKLNTITSWQKYNIINIIEDEINQSADDVEFCRIMNQVVGYVRRHRTWDYEELLKIDSEAVRLLSEVIFNKVIECVVTNNFNQAVLYLHAIDFINGGCLYNKNVLDWLGDDIKEQKNDLRMTVYEARLLGVISDIVSAFASCVDKDLDRIPADYEFPDALRNYNMADFDDAYNDLLTNNDFRNLKTKTYELSMWCLIGQIQIFFNDFVEDTLSDYRLYYIRALACCLDKCLYDEIIDSIDLSA